MAQSIKETILGNPRVVVCAIVPAAEEPKQADRDKGCMLRHALQKKEEEYIEETFLGSCSN